MSDEGPRPIICPNVHCGYRGPPDVLKEGTGFAGLFVGLFAQSFLHSLLPGTGPVVLAQPTTRYSAVCPRCQVNLGPTRAPALDESSRAWMPLLIIVGMIVLGLLVVRRAPEPSGTSGPAERSCASVDCKDAR